MKVTKEYVEPISAKEYTRTQTTDPEPLKTIIGELIDNALDATAMHVEVAVVLDGTNATVTVRDDGRGVEDMAVLFRVGGSVRHRGRHVSGMHGIGFKDAMVHLGGLATVYSCNEIGKVECRRSDFGKPEDEGFKVQHLDVSTLMFRRMSRSSPHGTIVEVANFSTERYPVGKWQYFFRSEALDDMFWPAIAEGRRIVVRLNGMGRTIRGCPAPIEEWYGDQETVRTRDGRAFTVRVASLKNESPYAGVTIVRGFRALLSGWRKPVENMGTLYAEVHLPASLKANGQALWFPSRHKDDLPRDQDKDAIAQAIAPILEPYLEREKRRRKSMTLAEVRSQVERLLTAALLEAELLDSAPKKASRGPNVNETGTVDPTGTGAPKLVTRVPKPETGTRVPVVPSSKKATGIELRFEEWTQANVLRKPGSADCNSNPWVVTLNMANPYVRFLLGEAPSRDGEAITVRSVSLCTFAATILSLEVAKWDPQQRQKRLPTFGDAEIGAVYERILYALQHIAFSGQEQQVVSA